MITGTSAARLKKNSPQVVPYRQQKKPVHARVKDLLARMTLEEKAAQMMCVWQEKAVTLVDAAGNFDLDKAKAAFKEGWGIGQVGRPSDAGSSPATPANGKSARRHGGTDERHPDNFSLNTAGWESR